MFPPHLHVFLAFHIGQISECQFLQYFPFLHAPFRCSTHTGLSFSPEGDGPTGGPPCPDADENLESDVWVLPEALESTLGSLPLAGAAPLACESTLCARGSGARFALGV